MSLSITRAVPTSSDSASSKSVKGKSTKKGGTSRRKSRLSLSGNVLPPVERISLIPSQRVFLNPKSVNRFRHKLKEDLLHFFSKVEDLPSDRKEIEAHWDQAVTFVKNMRNHYKSQVSALKKMGKESSQQVLAAGQPNDDTLQGIALEIANDIAKDPWIMAVFERCNRKWIHWLYQGIVRFEQNLANTFFCTTQNLNRYTRSPELRRNTRRILIAEAFLYLSEKGGLDGRSLPQSFFTDESLLIKLFPLDPPKKNANQKVQKSKPQAPRSDLLPSASFRTIQGTRLNTLLGDLDRARRHNPAVPPVWDRNRSHDLLKAVAQHMPQNKDELAALVEKTGPQVTLSVFGFGSDTNPHPVLTLVARIIIGNHLIDPSESFLLGRRRGNIFAPGEVIARAITREVAVQGLHSDTPLELLDNVFAKGPPSLLKAEHELGNLTDKSQHRDQLLQTLANLHGKYVRITTVSTTIEGKLELFEDIPDLIMVHTADGGFTPTQVDRIKQVAVITIEELYGASD